MALTNILTYSLQDASVGRKSLPIYFPDTVTLANLQTFNTSFAPLLDAVVDAKLIGASVTVQIALPGGIKTDAVVGNTVHEGGLMSFNAANTIYKPSYFIPSLENGGFAGDVVLDSGEYATLWAAFVSGLSTFQPSDKYANDLTSLIGGVRKFRK